MPKDLRIAIDVAAGFRVVRQSGGMSSNALRWAIGNPSGQMVVFPPFAPLKVSHAVQEYDPLDSGAVLFRT